MFLRTTVIRWKNSKGHNVINRDTEFFLNVNNMTDITQRSSCIRTWFIDSEKDGEIRAGIMEFNSSLDQIKTASMLKPPREINLKEFTLTTRDIIYVRTGAGGIWVCHNKEGDYIISFANLTMDGFADLI